MKETKIQNKRMGGKMHKQERGRKQNSGVKIHHGISREREGDSCRLKRR